MRVAFLTNCLPPYHKPVLEALLARHGQLRILLSTPMESNRSWEIDWRGLDVVVQKTITMRGRWRHPRGFGEPIEIHFPVDTVLQLGSYSPDIVISTELGFRTLLAVLYSKLHPRTKVIAWTEVTEASEQGRGLARQVLRRALRNNIHGFLALGAGGVRYIQTLGVDESRIFKLAYTTDVRRFASNGLERKPEQKRRLLYVGQLIERKGLAPFIAALSRWAEFHPAEQFEFILAGEGPLREMLERLRRPKNLSLTFLGSVAYGRLPQVYAEAGIFVLPSLVDTWAVVVNEAMAAGLPVLGSVYAQAVAEMVENGRTGWTFRPENAEEMQGALEQSLTTRDDQLLEMRINAREAALSLTPHRVADLIDTAIYACASGAESREVHG